MYKSKSLKYRKSSIQQYCINCGKTNHNYNNCMESLNSYGILCFYKDTIQLENKQNPNYNECYKLVMVRRQHTIPYVEFLRGKYNTLDIEYLIILFSRMTRNELLLISKNPNFDKLREELKLNNKQKKKYKDEYSISKNKFNNIIALGTLHYVFYCINYLFNESFQISIKSNVNKLPDYTTYIKNNKIWIDTIKIKICNSTIYTNPEWGVPKGRRQNKESDLKCALREFSEETGIASNLIKIYKNVIPLEETYIGLNGVEYKHTYFLAECLKLPSYISYSLLNINSINFNTLNNQNITNLDNTNQNITNLDSTNLDNTNLDSTNVDNINRNIIIPIKESNKDQLLEISSVVIMSLNQIKDVIRDYHKQKLNIINKGFYIILQMNYFFE